jgi:hypothetical protein
MDAEISERLYRWKNFIVQKADDDDDDGEAAAAATTAAISEK